MFLAVNCVPYYYCGIMCFSPQILQQKTHVEYGLNGICAETFVVSHLDLETLSPQPQCFPIIPASSVQRHVFADHPQLGRRLFEHLHHSSKAQTRHIGAVAFRQQCERYMALLDDALILETFVRMHAAAADAEPAAAAAGGADCLDAGALHELLATCFGLAMAHYLDDDRPATCPLLERTLASVTAAAFFSAPAGGVLSVGFVCRWLEQHCAHLVPPVHRFCVHRLTTAYR